METQTEMKMCSDTEPCCKDEAIAKADCTEKASADCTAKATECAGAEKSADCSESTEKEPDAS